MFMDRDDIVNLYVVTYLPLPDGALLEPMKITDDDIPASSYSSTENVNRAPPFTTRSSNGHPNRA
jgi:hypothetical protein